MRRRAIRGLNTAVSLFLLMAGGSLACGSDDSSGETAGVPEFLGQPPAGGAVTSPVDQGTPSDPDGAEPATPPASSSPDPATGSSEGQVPVGELTPPSTETPSSGEQNGDSSGETPVGTETPEPPVPETPAEEPPPEPAPTPRTQVFVLFGQSNMFGVPAPEAQDLPATEGAEVLTLLGCNAHGANQWVPAQPPLHGCVGQPSNGDFGPGLGPGDYFARVVTEAFPDDTILLVPNAIAGVSIDTFAPGAQAYNSMVSRARMAQQRGEIRGFLFHQGEADSGTRQTWVQRVATVVASLRRDLGVGESVPFIAAELPYDGCCGSGHNPFVNQLPNSIPNTVVVSAQGLGTYPEPSGDFAGQRLHFNVGAQRELGRRYANAFLQLASD